MDNISKERMIELVKCAPEGAVECSEANGNVCDIYRNQNGQYWRANCEPFKWRNADYNHRDFIKLDYSVIEAKTDDKQIPDDAPIHKMLADTGAFIAQGGKPVYTQERFDNDRQPLAGMKAMVSVKGGKPFECTVKYLGDITVIEDLCPVEHGFPLGNLKFTPIDTRTEQEKLVDDIAKLISSKGVMHNEVHASKEIAKLIANQFSITRKGESNE